MLCSTSAVSSQITCEAEKELGKFMWGIGTPTLQQKPNLLSEFCLLLCKFMLKHKLYLSTMKRSCTFFHYSLEEVAGKFLQFT
jgi:hypothetical protein